MISVVAFLVACGLLGARAPNASGAGAGVAAVFILLLGAVAVVGLVASIADTVRLHRLDPGIRAQAAPRTAHHPTQTIPDAFVKVGFVASPGQSGGLDEGRLMGWTGCFPTWASL